MEDPSRWNSFVEWGDHMIRAVTLGGVGAAIGLGQELLSPVRNPIRQIIGRAICTGGLSMAAGAIVIIIPSVPFYAQIGLAAVLGSLGTAALERMFSRFIGGAPR